MVPHTVSTITVAEALEILDLTPAELARKTGLGVDAVRRAVLGGPVRTNTMTADCIARAIGVSVEELSWPSGLTDEGRPPLTGGKYTKHHAEGTYCPEHHLLRSLSGECVLCAA